MANRKTNSVAAAVTRYPGSSVWYLGLRTKKHQHAHSDNVSHTSDSLEASRCAMQMRFGSIAQQVAQDIRAQVIAEKYGC